ncbi:MAG: YaaA family protein, partial [Lachnospiraceae bacterium]|nr:YaaA family protein [Lachnospiraceae bacterium]
MRIILSPAKKMNVDSDTLSYKGLPVYLEQTEEIAA